MPFAIADTSDWSWIYVGEDVNILLKLLQATDFNIERAERGIIYIDDWQDYKKAKNVSITRVSVKVQQALLIEGTVTSVPPQVDTNIRSEMIQVDTKNILFIVGGAFDSIEGNRKSSVWVRKSWTVRPTERWRRWVL